MYMTHNSYYPMSFPPKENFLDETLTWVLKDDLQVVGIQVQCTTLILSFQWGLVSHTLGPKSSCGWGYIKVVMCYTVILVYLLLELCY